VEIVVRLVKKNYAIFPLPSFSERKIIPLVAWLWANGQNYIDPNEDTKNVCISPNNYEKTTPMGLI
jgi:hypothetical protein